MHYTYWNSWAFDLSVLVVCRVGHMSPVVFCWLFFLQCNMHHLVIPPPSTAPTMSNKPNSSRKRSLAEATHGENDVNVQDNVWQRQPTQHQQQMSMLFSRKSFRKHTLMITFRWWPADEITGQNWLPKESVGQAVKEACRALWRGQ